MPATTSTVPVMLAVPWAFCFTLLHLHFCVKDNFCSWFTSRCYFLSTNVTKVRRSGFVILRGAMISSEMSLFIAYTQHTMIRKWWLRKELIMNYMWSKKVCWNQIWYLIFLPDAQLLVYLCWYWVAFLRELQTKLLGQMSYSVCVCVCVRARMWKKWHQANIFFEAMFSN
jgi:hypothetical protein